MPGRMGVEVGVLESLFTSLVAVEVSDVLAQGFIERDSTPPKFVPLARVWYLELDDGFLRLESVRDEVQLVMRRVSEIEPPKELDAEDEEFALASHGALFFDTAGPALPITKIRYVTNERSDLEKGVLRYVEFELLNSQRIVFDPKWHYGIRPGPTGMYERLVAESRQSEKSVAEYFWVP